MKRQTLLHKNTHRKGFSLIEVVLYFALASTMVIALSAFFSAVIQSRIKGVAIMELESQGLDAMNLMTQTIRNSDAITAPASGATATTLTLDTPTSSNDPTIFQITNDVLTIKEGSSAAIPLTANPIQATQLTFQNLTRSGTPGEIRIQLTLARKNILGRQEFTYTKTFTTSSALRQP